MAPDPDLYAIHYRFLETFDESFDYGTDDRARPGPLADPRHRPARRRPAQGLSRQRPAGPAAGARRDRRPRGSYRLGARRGLDACASRARHVHRPRPRPPPEPAQGAAPGRPGVGDVRGDGRRSSGRSCGRSRRARPGRCSTRRSARPGDRRRVAARRGGRLDRRDRGDRLRGPATARVSRVLAGWGVAKAKRMGASAAKLLVYYHPDAPNAAEQERLVGRGRRRLPRGRPRAVPRAAVVLARRRREADRRGAARVVIETARRLTAIGGDILKAEFPYDASVTDEARWREACAELDAATRGAVGAAVGRRRRRDVRAPGRGRLRAPARAACSPAGRCGRRRRRSTRRPGTVPRDDRPRAAAPARRARRRRRPAVARAPGRRSRRRREPGEGWYREYAGERAARAEPGERDIDLLVVGEINPDIVISDPDPGAACSARSSGSCGSVDDDRRQLVGDLRLRRRAARAAGRVRRRRRRRRVRPLHARRDGGARGRRLGVHRRPGRADRGHRDPDERPRPGDPDRDGHDRRARRRRRAGGAARAGAPRPLGRLLPPGAEPRSAAGVLRGGPRPRPDDVVRHELGPDRARGTAASARCSARPTCSSRTRRRRRGSPASRIRSGRAALAATGAEGRLDGGPIVVVKRGPAGAVAAQRGRGSRSHRRDAGRAGRHDRRRRLVQRRLPAGVAGRRDARSTASSWAPSAARCRRARSAGSTASRRSPRRRRRSRPGGRAG